MEIGSRQNKYTSHTSVDVSLDGDDIGLHDCLRQCSGKLRMLFTECATLDNPINTL